MLGRLRPVGLAEFGLAGALDNLVEFWRRRHPEIEYRIDLAADCEALGEPTDTTAYRVVQECLSNAVRHGPPGRIAVTIERDAGSRPDRDTVRVEVSDDGPGMIDTVPGFGLRGMAERVKASGGRLTFANRPAGGLAVTAVLPCSTGERAFDILQTGEA